MGTQYVRYFADFDCCGDLVAFRQGSVIIVVAESRYEKGVGKRRFFEERIGTDGTDATNTTCWLMVRILRLHGFLEIGNKGTTPSFSMLIHDFHSVPFLYIHTN